MTIDHSLVQSALLQTQLRMRYPAGKYSNGREFSGVDELRPLTLLPLDLPELFTYSALANQVPPPVRSRPRFEVQAATVLHGVYGVSAWHEEWVSFWREHFSVFGYDGNVGPYLPHWDREVIRKHCLGNFFQFLEASAQHPCMLYYLNNRSSRAGNANENFARELLELHTLGQGAYLNFLYSDWRKVPGALQGKPTGYIDEDVYEAARAFTGWTVEDGSGIGGGQRLPKTGRFTYVAQWHDSYQKRVLATELRSHTPALADGQAVLRLCANHPASAQHLAKKLVRRFVSEELRPEWITSTAQVFLDQRDAPNQLAWVLAHLVHLAENLPAAQKQKARRPTRLLSAFVSATRLPFQLGEGQILEVLNRAGPPIYGWPSPDGPPDDSQWNLGAAYLHQRHELVLGLAQNSWGTGEFNPFERTAAQPRYREFLGRWEEDLFGESRPELSQALLMAQRINADERLTDPKRARYLVGLLACSPSFQTEVVLPSMAEATRVLDLPIDSLVPSKKGAPVKKRTLTQSATLANPAPQSSKA